MWCILQYLHAERPIFDYVFRCHLWSTAREPDVARARCAQYNTIIHYIILWFRLIVLLNTKYLYEYIICIIIKKQNEKKKKCIYAYIYGLLSIVIVLYNIRQYISSIIYNISLTLMLHMYKYIIVIFNIYKDKKK